MKYVIDNPDYFLDQNDQIKMVTPEIIQEQETAEQNEQPVLKIENDARCSDESESESQQKTGLNSEMLRSLDQAQTAATPAQNSMQ